MRFMERFGAAVKAFQFGGWGGGYGSGYGDLWGTGSDGVIRRTEFDYQREAGNPWENSVFWIALRWIANNYQEADPCVYRKVKGSRDVQIVEGHPYERLMNDPNPDYDGGVLAWAIVTSLLSAGKCRMICELNQLGFPTKMYWVPWWQLVPRWAPNGNQYIGWYDYHVNGKVIPIPKENVIDLKIGLNPFNYREGLSGTQSILPQICTINESARFMAAITRNPLVFSALFSPKDGNVRLTKEQHAELKKVLKEAGGGDNRGSIIVPNIGLTVEKLAWSPEELALDKVLQMPEAHICGALGVSPVVLNLTGGDAVKGQARSNSEQKAKDSYLNGVIPLQKLVSRQMRRQFQGLFQDDERPGYDYSLVECMQENRNDKSKRLAEAAGGAFMTVNEARSAFNLPGIGPAGDIIREKAPPVKADGQDEEDDE